MATCHRCGETMVKSEENGLLRCPVCVSRMKRMLDGMRPKESLHQKMFESLIRRFGTKAQRQHLPWTKRDVD